MNRIGLGGRPAPAPKPDARLRGVGVVAPQQISDPAPIRNDGIAVGAWRHSQ
jgi:hypothetical protein